MVGEMPGPDCVVRCLWELQAAEAALARARGALSELNVEDQCIHVAMRCPAGRRVEEPPAAQRAPAADFASVASAAFREAAAGRAAPGVEPSRPSACGTAVDKSPWMLDQIVVSTIDASLKSHASGVPDASLFDESFYRQSDANLVLRGSSLSTESMATKQRFAVELLTGDIVWQRVFQGRVKVPMLHPAATCKMAWLVLGFAFILFEVFAIPVYIAFDIQPEGAQYAFVSLVNAYFILDICVHFLSGYMDAAGEVITEPSQVAREYARKWLVPDMVASIPWEWISAEGSSASVKMTRSLRVIRSLRILRLLRLMRVAKLRSLTANLEARLESNHHFVFALGILRISGLLLVVCHWSACVWYGIGTGRYYSAENADQSPASWVAVYQDIYPFIGEDKSHHYVFSLYFCLTTMTTVGYGDITPKNYDEVRCTMLLLILSSVLFATLMGTLTDMCATINMRNHLLAEKKIHLSRYMNFRAVPWKLWMSIRQHLVFVWETNDGYDGYEEELRLQLSPVLKAELCHHIYGRILMSAPFLAWMRDFPTCTKHLAERVRSTFLTPGDHILRMGEVNDQIYMLLTGKVVLSRIEHLFDQDGDRGAALPDSGALAFEIPRGKLVGTATPAAAQQRSQHGMSRTGHAPLGSGAMATAAAELLSADIRNKAAARTVQRLWRTKMERRAASRAAHGEAAPRTAQHRLKGDLARRRHFSAPAYFGEACLWQPAADWGRKPAPRCTYTVLCESRGELVCIPRDAIRDLLGRFAPWLPLRLERFRSAVQAELEERMQGDEGFRQVSTEWASAE